MSEGTAGSVITFFISAAAAVFLVAMCIEIKACSASGDRADVERHEQVARTTQACIASQRSAVDCALILHGTGR